MNIENMKSVLGIAHKAQSAIHMIGKHGIGKTEIVKQFAEDQGFHCEVLQLTVMDTGDLIGMPDTIEKDSGKVATWAKPIWLDRIAQANKEGKHCVVFFDELGRAAFDVRQAALQMVLEGKIQEHSLGELDGLKSLVVVADNPADDYDSEAFDGALEDRFMTFDVDTAVEGWLKYARSIGVLPVISDYVAEYPEKLHFSPEDTAEKGSSPRAWVKLSDVLKNTPQNSNLAHALIVSKVGKTVGSNFYNFYQNYVDVVKPEDIEAAIGNAKLNTAKAQEDAAKKLSKLTSGIEAIAATELANKIKENVEAGKTKAEILVVYVASLNFEVGASIVKGWANDEKDLEFLVGAFRDAQPNTWFVTKIYNASH